MLSPAVERAGGFPKPQTGHSGVTKTHDSLMPSAMSDEDLVNALAQYLDFEPLEKQALLEKGSLRARAESLVELLEMKIMMARRPVSRTSRISLSAGFVCFQRRVFNTKDYQVSAASPSCSADLRVRRSGQA